MKQLIAIATAALAMLAMTGNANAITISPADAVAGYGYGGAGQGGNCEPSCVETVFGLDPAVTLNLLYKGDGDGGEAGSFASSYQTIFSNTASDPADADILWTGGSVISCSSCYLAIKDGNHSPGYYFYDLSGEWNGTDNISLRGFWPNGGAISHVSIWGIPGSTSVPEPSTLALLGIGLLGAGLAKRRRKV